MKRRRVSILISLLTAVAVLPCLAADSAADGAWSGTWKLNQEKSKFTGETFTLTSTSTGMHFSNGTTVEYDLACDGKDYPTIADRTMSCANNGGSAYDSINKVQGKETSRTHRELSDDGKTLTVLVTGTQPDGVDFSETDVYARVGNGRGVAGKWKNVRSEVSVPDVLTVKIAGDAIHWEIPGYKQTLDGKIDEKPVAMKGPLVPAGLTISFKRAGAMKLSYAVRLQDRMLDEGEQVVSADGKTLTDTSWVAGKPGEKQVAVYERQ